MLSIRVLTVTAALAATALVACADTEQPAGGASPSMEPVEMGHVHGLGRNPADGSLYAATHLGLFQLGQDEHLRVADRYQDTMGFVVTGPDRFLGSGHPDLREDLPPHLGLIESQDAGLTWESVALLGEADFHAMDVSGDRLYAYDGLSQRLFTTTDRQGWEVIDTGPLIDIAANPGDDGLLAYTTPGLDTMLLTGASPNASVSLEQAPPLAYLDWQDRTTLVGIGPDGLLGISADRGRTWLTRDAPPGVPAALVVAPGRWDLATTVGVFTSTDDGASWEPLLEHG